MSVVELGAFALVTAFILALFQTLSPFILCRSSEAIQMTLVKRSANGQSAFLALSFFCLMYAYITSDFSVANVAANSHTLKPLFYKITGVWGNHEGSMLLWALVLSLFGLGMSVSRSFDAVEPLRKKSLIIQGAIGAMILAFILFTSHPFERLNPIPDNGNGLNPLLQDPGLAFHPPLLYGGYVGFSAVFAVACAALWQGEFGRKIGRLVRIWCLIAWSSLTAGIGLGMWWAYYELGWGGFWFWDPVENASLMPWLAGTALLHSAVMVEKRDILKSWTALLAIFAFGSSMLGTFIVRSGIITSVHSFAASPERGIFILLIFFITVGGALALYAIRSDLLRSENDDYDIVSREGALVINNYLMSGILLIVVTGTLYPTFLEVLASEKISVGAPYFNKTTSPLIYMIGILCPLAVFLSWREGQAKKLVKPLMVMGAIMVGAVIMTLLLSFDIPPVAFFVILLGIWTMSGTILDFIFKGGLKKPSIILREDIAKIGAHLSLGLLMIGVAGAGMMHQEKTLTFDAGQTHIIGKDSFTFLRDGQMQRENYLSDIVELRHDQTGEVYYPERRFFTVSKQTTTEADIHLNFWRDIYVTIGARLEEGKRVLNIRIHPLVGFMWAAIALASLSSLIRVFIMLRQRG